MELNFGAGLQPIGGASGRPSPYPTGAPAGLMGPPTPVTPSTPNSALLLSASAAAAGAPRLDPARPLDTAATLLHALRALVNHVYAPTLPAAASVCPPKAAAAALAAAAAGVTAGAAAAEDGAAAAVTAAASALVPAAASGSGSGTDLTRFHALSASLACHSWERAFVEFDDRLSVLQRHVNAAEEKLHTAAQAMPPASAAISIAPAAAQAAANAALKKYVYFSERASNAQHRLMGVSGACHRSVALIDAYRSKRAAQLHHQQQIAARKPAAAAAAATASSLHGGGDGGGGVTADETIDEVAAVLEMIRALQHAKQQAGGHAAGHGGTGGGAAANGADGKPDPAAVAAAGLMAPGTGAGAGSAAGHSAGAFASVNAALLATGAVPPLTSISTAACSNGANGIGWGGGGAASTAASAATGSSAVLDELEVIVDGDSDAAGGSKPQGDLSIMFGSSAKAETLILDVKMRYHTTTTTAPAAGTSAGTSAGSTGTAAGSSSAVGDKRGATAMDVDAGAGGAKRLKAENGAPAAVNGAAHGAGGGAGAGAGARPVTTTHRHIAVESVAASIMMGQNTGQPRDYTHPQMDDDVRQLFLLCARGAAPTAAAAVRAAAANATANAMSPVSALATARLLHKLLRIREKEKCLDRHAGGGALDGMGLGGGGGGGGPTTMAAERLRRMFGEVEATLDAFAAVPLTRCRRVLEGLACVYLELPATACSAALLPHADSAAAAAFLTAVKTAAASAATASPGSAAAAGGVSFALTYVGPFEHVWAPMPVPGSSQPHHTPGGPPSPTHDLALDTDRQPTFSYAFEVNSSLSSVADPLPDAFADSGYAPGPAAGVLFPASVAAAVARLCALPPAASAAEIDAAAASAFAAGPTAGPTPAAAAAAEVRDRELCARGASFASALMPTVAAQSLAAAHAPSPVGTALPLLLPHATNGVAHAPAAGAAAATAGASSSSASASGFAPHHTVWVLDQTHAFRLNGDAGPAPPAAASASASASGAASAAANGAGAAAAASSPSPPPHGVWLRERALRVSQVLVSALPAAPHPNPSLAATAFGRALGLFRAQVLFNHLLSTCFAPSCEASPALPCGSTTARVMVTPPPAGGASGERQPQPPRQRDWHVRVPSPHCLLLTMNCSSGTVTDLSFAARITVAAHDLTCWPVVTLEAVPTRPSGAAPAAAAAQAVAKASAYATQVLRATLHVPLMLAYACRALKLA